MMMLMALVPLVLLTPTLITLESKPIAFLSGQMITNSSLAAGSHHGVSLALGGPDCWIPTFF